ncbi:MAG: glycoside hydrolase family 13 protein [Anaerolineaceae bacterium]|nr:glycoside hydrolase family 13 protein [Anaerolineaceae bacterium]
MSVPSWVHDAIFYQIFVDRFANGDPSNDPPNLEAWGSPPSLWGFQGGDLRGIMQKLDYLLDLGINTLYLTPIFQSSSTHRYNTYDYYRIDSKLGSHSDFRALVDAVHAKSMRIILDGVFNHCGRGFWAFNDLLENQDKSPYKDWYFVNHFPIDAYSPGEARDYVSWWRLKSLPKFNTSNPQVRKYLMGVGRYWTEQGIDGWRLDVPNEIDDDSFWAEFRQTVRGVNPDAYLVGEIWEMDPRWANATHFDGLMNYPQRTALLGLLNGSLKVSQFASRVEELLQAYPKVNAYAMMTLAGSHDVERIITLCNGDLRKVQMAYLFLFTYPGAPMVYYGDEVGLEGGKDPDNRRAFPWGAEVWKAGLRTWLQHLIGLRKHLAALRRGSYLRLLVDDTRGCYVYARVLGDEKVIVALNTSNTRRILRVPVGQMGWSEGHILHNQLGKGESVVSGLNLVLSVRPWSGLVLR